MTEFTKQRIPCGCCFVVPPSLLKALSSGHKLKPRNPEIFQKSFEETQRLLTRRLNAPPLTPNPTATAALQQLFDFHNATGGPGQAIADPATAGREFATVFNTTAKVAKFYHDVFGRNSIDNKGAKLVSVLNYSKDFQNALWDGEQMLYGNGDQHIFNDFWESPDVIAHELTHGVTQHESQLGTVGESGALNESISDCFGVAFNQWLNKWPASEDKGWLVGAQIVGPDATAEGHTCVRDMINPSAKHCLTPQQDTYDGIDELAESHVNSGIPNRAFALFAREFGGNAYEEPIRIWYTACTGGRLNDNSVMSDFAQLTIDAANQCTGPEKGKLVAAAENAWKAVKVLPPPPLH